MADRRRALGILHVSAGALVAGLLGGLSAVAFRALTTGLTDIFFFRELSAIPRVPLENTLGWQVLLVPIAGGAIIVLLRRFLPGGKATGGTPEVIDAASLRGGSLPLVTTVKTVLIAAVSLGSGGSAGREGPIVQLGGLGGALVGALRFGREQRRILVACGATAGLAATFNAPIAAVVFGLEVILLEFRTISFAPLVISSVVGTSVGRLMLGNKPTFQLPLGLFSLGGPWDLAFYALLGFLAGLVGITLLKLYEYAEGAPRPRWLPQGIGPIVGMALLGVLGLLEPRVFGVGYETVNDIFNNRLAGPGVTIGGLALLLGGLLILKPLAVALTLRSGGSGGVFSPTLFEGSALGALFGLGLAELAPGLGADPASFALVGMAAVFAAVTRATFTAIVLVAELTLSFDVVVPVMLACVTADIVTWTVHPGSLYTDKLAARGRPVATELAPNVLDLVLVREAMNRDPRPLLASASLRDYLDHAMATDRQAFPLLDKEGHLTGIVTRTDLRTKSEGMPLDRPVAAIATRDVVVAYPDETVHMALSKMVGKDVGHLPVVERGEHQVLVGWLTRADILNVERMRDQ